MNLRLLSNTYLRTLIKALLRLVKPYIYYLFSLLKNLIIVYNFILTFINLTSYYIKTNILYLLLIRPLPELIKLRFLLSLIFIKYFIRSIYILTLRN